MIVDVIKILIKNLNDLFVDNNIKKEMIELIEFKKDYKKIILFFFLIPISSSFFLINAVIFVISLIFYFYTTIFIYKKKLLYKNKKNKIIKYKKGFKFLKNFYLIILEKILFEFPKKKAYLFFYIIIKSIIEKNKMTVEIKIIEGWIKSLSNRIIIKLVLGLPFIVIKINKDLINLIWDLKEFEYSNNSAFIETLLLNIFKNVTPDYNKFIEKLKIMITSKSIRFNSKKEIIKATKYKEQFKEDFSNIKKKCIYTSVQHKINENSQTKFHPTLILKNKNNNVMYVNETSSKELNYFKYNNNIKKYTEEKQKNCRFHKGSISKNKITYYTKPILTDKKNLIIHKPAKDKLIMNNLYEENTNNITASFLTNLDSYIIEIVNSPELKKNIMIKNEKEKKFIEWVKDNKEIMDNQLFETLLKIEFFWKENEKVIENMDIENKIELAKVLGIGIEEFKNIDGTKFKILTNFISRNFKEN